MKETIVLEKKETATSTFEQFKKEVNEGLSEPIKSLPSKFFYDEKGDALFVQIMHLPEYYVTRSEHEIFKNKSNTIIDALQLNPDTYFELIELGAGDGTKTKELLQALSQQQYQFDYLPVDISQNALDMLEADLNKEMPHISVKTKQGDYFEVLESLKENEHPKVILFLGSNIGNMSDQIAASFISNLSANLGYGDKLFLGVDLIKSTEIVLPAYNDSQGVTAAFNLNLLDRINRELDADFEVENFKHQPEYDEKEGIATSFLVSIKEQVVFVKKLNKTFRFAKGEKILTEISRKYNDRILNKILKKTAFVIKDKITDSQKYFANYVLERL
ncbi:L-histidine N(alpha)-methyltransferase [Flavobacterium agrisoli]|uniref:L-histidine N(Alpha)-methyltransferase n=1 Tax=Flavobacterium agrisoli TaxID=2793066 RepID=A0A934UI20_9FLAO|nr:L-histidine N(alpha)-methyltransferase [Flavobacterium agrisoli]MBK0368386.1 L-histidine N(alpha)-methyltransferase [Flavobacterium agrisoli]